MKIKRARYPYAHDRQARKPRRRLLFAGLFSVILLLFCGYGVASFVKDTSMPSAETVPQAQIPGIGIIKNTNQLLGTDGVIGIKTGTTDEAGHCLLFAARYVAEDGQKVTIVGVIMGDTNATSLFSDSRKLLASAKQMAVGVGLEDGTLRLRLPE